MVYRELVAYIRGERDRGASDDDITQQLVERGWEKEQVEEAFSSLAENVLPKPQTVLRELKALIQAGAVTKEEVFALFGEQPAEKQSIPEAEEEGNKLFGIFDVHIDVHVSLQNALYIIGLVIAAVGLSIFIGQFWIDWEPAMQSLFTLGVASLVFGAGYYLYQKAAELRIFSYFSFLVFVVLIPLGMGSGIRAFSSGSENISLWLTISSALTLAVFLAVYILLRLQLFLVVAVAAGSALFVGVTNLIVEGRVAIDNYGLYRALVLGISYTGLAYYYRHMAFTRWVGAFFGYSFILGALLGLAAEFEILMFLYPLVLFGALYVSMRSRERLLYVIAILFGLGYVGIQYDVPRSEQVIALYRVLALGVGYLGLSYYFRSYMHIKDRAFTILDFLGLGTALGAMFALSFEQGIWEVLMSLIFVGVAYLGVYLRNQLYFFFGVAFIVFEILRLTGERFADSIGWPLSLIFAGFAIIAIAYITFRTRQEIFSDEAEEKHQEVST